MSQAKPLASLSSGLLARKGQARPAMRQQAYDALDDLGWNDMGYDPAPASAARPEPEALPDNASRDLGNDGMASLETLVVPGSRAEALAKAAFTLRLDAARHLKLRLACALTRRSAQEIVIGALDAHLKTVPDLDALAGAVPKGSDADEQGERGEAEG
ncbi:MAG: hypothetical protein JWN59_740 [Sphingomonas bacterium]|nr:hypothetical protein [Sphingomonas bacterium]